MANLILKRLDMKEDIFSTQKCYISPKLSEPKLRIGQYVYIKTSCLCKYLCKVFFMKDLTEIFCQFDTSVAVLGNANKYDGSFPKYLNFSNVDCISTNNLIPVTTPIQIAKRITVSIVTESVKERTHWSDNNNALILILKGLLKNYTFSKLSVLNLKNFKQYGIFCVFVEEIENADPEFIFKLNTNSKIIISTLISKKKFEQLKHYNKIIPLGGLHKPYLILKEIISHVEKHSKNFLKPSQQVLLIGPPGCGKTSLVRKVAADCGAILITVHGPEVCMPKPGDTEQQLRDIFSEAADYTKEGTCVILLDEIDSLCPRPGTNKTVNHTTRMVSQILTLLEKADSIQGLVIIATTNVPYLVDPAVRRPGRLSTEVHIGFPTKEERKNILMVLSSSLIGENIKDIDNFYTTVADLTPGYVGADLSLLCQDVALHIYKNPERNNAADLLTAFCQAAAKIRPSSLRGGLGIVSSREISLSEIGGLETVKKTMQAAVEWPLLYPLAFQKLGLPHPKGVLLYGPPGCAKTSIACALAAATKTNFLSVSAAEIYSPYVGDAERNVSELFQRARQGAPTIVFIDEIDALVGSREGRETGVQERILSSFLTEMDGIGLRIDSSPSHHKISVGEKEDSCTIQQVSREKVHNTGIIVIAATNRPDMLDDALLRPGRFDKHIYVPPPDMETRLNILKVVTSKMPLASEVDLSAIAEATDLYSGADLANVCKEAGLCALTEEGMDVEYIKQAHFLEALRKSNPSLSKQQIEFYENYRR